MTGTTDTRPNMGHRLHDIISQKVMGRGLSDSVKGGHEHKMSSLHISPAGNKTRTYRATNNVDAGYVEERGLRALEGSGSCQQGIASDLLHEKSDHVDHHELDGSTVEESWLQRAASDGRSHVVQVYTALFNALVSSHSNISSHRPHFIFDHFHPHCLANATDYRAAQRAVQCSIMVTPSMFRWSTRITLAATFPLDFSIQSITRFEVSPLALFTFNRGVRIQCTMPSTPEPRSMSCVYHGSAPRTN